MIEVTLGLRPDVQKDRPTIGITPEEGEGGLKLTDLVENGPASKANLQVGDVINTIDTKAIKTRREMLEILTTKNMGDKITIGCIGVGSMGMADAAQHVHFGRIVAVCDVDSRHAERAKNDDKLGKGKADAYADYRKVLERNDIE